MNSVLITCFCAVLFGFVHSSPLKVVNGNEVVRNSIPYQAHIQLFTDFGFAWNCTGVLITGRYVLTSSKCQWSGPTKANVTLGAHEIKEVERAQASFYAKKFWKIYNTEFVYSTLENNIGLIKLPSTVNLTEEIKVATLAESGEVTVGQTGTISGWGLSGSKLETVLYSANVTVVNNSICAAEYPVTYTGPNTICVQGLNDASACNGDGGAPLVIDGKVVGIFSGGPSYIHTIDVNNCAGKPNIFTKVASYIDWVKNNSDYGI